MNGTEVPPLIFKILTVNEWAAFVVSIVANIGLLWLIQKSTPEFLRPYGQILRIHCVSDILNCITMLITGVECIPVHDKIFYVLHGTVRNNGNPQITLLFIGLFHMTVVFVPIFQLPLDFIYRYFVICRGKQLSNKSIYLLVGLFYSMAAFWGLVLVPIQGHVYLEPSDKEEIWEAIGYQNPNVGFIVTKEFLTLMIMLVLNMIISSEYMFIVYTVRKISSKSDGGPSGHRRFNGQIMMILMIQAAIPLLLCIPTFVNLTFCLFQIYLPSAGHFGAIGVPWLAAVRPIGTIFAIPHYRKRCFGKQVVTMATNTGSRMASVPETANPAKSSESPETVEHSVGMTA